MASLVVVSFKNPGEAEQVLGDVEGSEEVRQHFVR